jgi:hypothetical protein
MPDHAKSALPSWVHWLFGVAIIALAVDSGLVLFDTSTGFIERVIGASINFLTGFAVLGLLAYGFSLLIRLARKKLFGGAGQRPTISQELSGEAHRLNDLVDWFVTNEDGVRRHVSTVLHALLLLGSTASGKSRESAELEFRDELEFHGLRNQTTFRIWQQLAAIRRVDGRIAEEDLNRVLTEFADDLSATVIHLRQYDTTGNDLASLLRNAEPLALKFVQGSVTMDSIQEIRALFARAVFNDQPRRHLGAIFVHKNTSEIAFYILCWLYYSWYGRQFYSPPSPYSENFNRLERKLRSIASKPKIAAVIAQFGMSDDPLAEENSLYEHFLFLLESRVVTNIALRRLASPDWLRYSIEMRRSGESPSAIAWALTDEGRLYRRGSSPLLGGVIPGLINLFRRYKKPPKR